jgi:hypothetical protein
MPMLRALIIYTVIITIALAWLTLHYTGKDFAPSLRVTQFDQEKQTVTIPAETYNGIKELIENQNAAIKALQTQMLEKAKEIAKGKECI